MSPMDCPNWSEPQSIGGISTEPSDFFTHAVVFLIVLVYFAIIEYQKPVYTVFPNDNSLGFNTYAMMRHKAVVHIFMFHVICMVIVLAQYKYSFFKFCNIQHEMKFFQLPLYRQVLSKQNIVFGHKGEYLFCPGLATFTMVLHWFYLDEKVKDFFLPENKNRWYSRWLFVKALVGRYTSLVFIGPFFSLNPYTFSFNSYNDEFFLMFATLILVHINCNPRWFFEVFNGLNIIQSFGTQGGTCLKCIVPRRIASLLSYLKLVE